MDDKSIFKYLSKKLLDESINTKRRQLYNAIDEYGSLSQEAHRAGEELDAVIDKRMKEGILNAR